MFEAISQHRGLLVGSIFILLIIGLIAAYIYGRRVIRTEKTDAVFGNPERALGGWYWVFAGVSTILLIWLYFSWDAARSFFPKSANELCQVAKVDTAINPMRSVFPIQSRLLKGTSLLARDGGQLQSLKKDLLASGFTEQERSQFSGLIDELEGALFSLASPDNVDPVVKQNIADIAARLDDARAQLADPQFPAKMTAEERAEADAQPGWGEANTEVPNLPITERGRKFNAISTVIAEISKDFLKIRNLSSGFDQRIDDIGAKIKAFEAELESAGLDSDQTLEREQFLKQMNKMLKRIDDGTVFPPGTLAPIENSVRLFEAEVSEQKGSLKIIDALALPSGTIVAGSTNCSEQGSGRWLPKPSDTLGTLVDLSSPSVGYKGVPMLWYKHKPVAEMVGFFIPDWVADLVPGEYPRHNPDGTIDENLKTKVLNVATGNFPSMTVPVPTGHIWDSIMRVVAGLFLGIVLGVPLGLFMGLSRFAKGFFDPLIELYRPVPPLAWAPLILTIFGIQDDGKIFLLFMVAFAIMVISARTGATGTQLSKIHAAHSLGASRKQIIREVILPNSLPEILTGIRISIGVCWGTLVAAEMLAGTTGIGFVENVARKQSDYEIIWVTIILLGVLGLIFDLIMRWIINRTIPWRGKG
ncbi:MAG: ABC transporter permease [Pseudomonadota bacterium]